MSRVSTVLRLPELVQAQRSTFAERFAGGSGALAPRLFFAPGRVNLMGAHLDYNGGPVMPMALHAGTLVAVRPRDDGRLRLSSTLEDEVHELDVGGLPARPRSSWTDYPVGVVRELLVLRPDWRGADVLFGGNLPIGAGLSSSASICVATAFALGCVAELELDEIDLVRIALAAEREFVGVQCGIMDPYAVGFARPGHLLWLDCRDRSLEHLPLDPREVVIAVADTGVRRRLAQGEFNRRVDECAAAFEVLARHAPDAACLRDVPAEVLREHAGELTRESRLRAQHVVEEVERTFAARRALLAGDLPTFGRMMSEAHASLARLFEVSVPELDCLVEAALSHEGVLGSRLTGAGFGGCTVALLASGAVEGYAERLGERFESRFGRRPEVTFFEGDPGPRELD